MLAPMQPELQPIVRRLDLEGDGSLYRGRAGAMEVVAMLTTIGMTAGAQAARRMLEHDVDWVMVVGIAGGVDRSVPIGGVIVPEVVIDRATGGRFRPTRAGPITPRGTLSCGDELITGPAELDAMAAQGVVAVDMETAAVAAVCDGAQVPWSVFRGISDYAGEGLVDDAVFAMTRPDGTADPEVIARYLDDARKRLALLRCVPLTGRQHQIRAHLQAAGFPLVGDKLYGPSEEIFLRLAESGGTPAPPGMFDDLVTPDERTALRLWRQALHASELTLPHPGTGEITRFTAPLPADISALIATLRPL